MAATATISQISFFSSINRKLNLHPRNRSMVSLPFRSSSKFSVVMQLERGGTESPSLEANSTLSHSAGESNLHAEGTVRIQSSTEEPFDGKPGSDVELHEQDVTQPKKAAKLHDFCLGIPYGGFVLGEGVLLFLSSRNPLSLLMGVPYGGALLALSTLSLMVWRQQKSNLPFILGQAALAAAVFWKHFQNYSLTKKFYPAGAYAVVSAAMLCFYSYVMISGGNPPPKKKKLATATPSS